MAENIIIVDENDKAIGTKDKTDCHAGDGILHRAFIAMVINSNGELLLARRSTGKMLWPGYWDGTIASHLHEGEDHVAAVKRRFPDELGIEAKEAEYVGKFQYHIPYKDVGSEREICGMVIVRSDSKVQPNPEEISEVYWVSLKDLAGTLDQDEYCPWLIIALRELEDLNFRK